MLLVDALLLAIVIALLRGGSLRRLAEIDLRRIDLMFMALVLQYGTYELTKRGWETGIRWGPALHVLSYMLLLAALWSNRRLPGFAVLTAGVVLNFLVICANGGQMPVSLSGIERAGLTAHLPALLDGRMFTHTLITEETRFTWLADVLVVPPPYPRPRVFSVGDVLMVAGAFLLVQRTLVHRRQPQAGRAPSPPAQA